MDTVVAGRATEGKPKLPHKTTTVGKSRASRAGCGAKIRADLVFKRAVGRFGRRVIYPERMQRPARSPFAF
jgi:hypothetical protein